MTGVEIVAAAKKFKGLVYWYGGKRQLCTVALADRLKRENPNVWTTEYYRKALTDVQHHRRCCDCSGLVCGAYGIEDIGTGSFLKTFKAWRGAPKSGMIAWRSGHCGIFLSDGWNSKIAEMRGIDWDYRENRTFSEAGFTKVLYSPSVSYETLDSAAVPGWHVDATGWWYRHTPGTGPATYYHDCGKIINEHCYIFDNEGYIRELGTLGKRVPPTSKEGWIDG
nr:MAG TPA: hypothetical protein [Bacteriophage sp.]